MELEAENWRLCSITLVRGVSVELEDENWRQECPLRASHKLECPIRVSYKSVPQVF